MKIRCLRLFAVIMMACVQMLPTVSVAQSRIASEKDNAGSDQDFYLTVDQISDLLKWLPAPPDTLDEAFAHDIMRYFWGKAQRLDAERAEIAIRDANFSVSDVCEAFSVPFGLPVSENGTPEIYKLMVKGLNTIDLISILPKEYWMRRRPFDRMHEPSLTPESDALLSYDGSYPSAHAIRGWGAALLMVEINPEAADTLLARGLMYGESRVIVGAHWQSDVDAGRLAASAAYALMHTSPAFMHQMAKAQEEFRRLKGWDMGMAAPERIAGGDSREYTVSGMPATPQTRGVVIRDSQKMVRK